MHRPGTCHDFRPFQSAVTFEDGRLWIGPLAEQMTTMILRSQAQVRGVFFALLFMPSLGSVFGDELQPSLAVRNDSASMLRTVVLIDVAAGGRVFEGVGAVSAGASSRLLVNYPEKQRREVLDYLFKPDFGAGFQHLKVEIGGEVNSTDGIEPTHMRTRDDENYGRGYEWWLMQEAKRRNRDLILDCLAWGAPGWIGGGNYYSQDMADYVVKFLQGAKQLHHLDIAYTGIWNETTHDTNWIKLLRRTLDRAGLHQVGIVAADDYADDGWKIVHEMANDPELYAAVARVGVHYRGANSPAVAQALGCPLWSSEDGPWRGDWVGAMSLARTLNRNYVSGRFTETEIWSPVTAYYDSLPLPGSGVMRANEPWSGHYEVPPTVWAVAHTTQFAQPGWRYIDSACILIEGGSMVALASPQDNNFSLIIETSEAKMPQQLEFQLAAPLSKPVYAWRTSKEEQFKRIAVLHPDLGKFSLLAEPGCIYSLTTTIGQSKGVTLPPPSKVIALPYQDDFTAYRPGTTPRLFSDQAGVFEVQRCPNREGNCLREILTHDGIPWPNHPDPAPETIFGDLAWQNYCLATDVLIEPGSYVTLLGRVSVVPNNASLPSCYCLKLDFGGSWELRNIRTEMGDKPWIFHTTGDAGPPLARGHLTFTGKLWHHLSLGFKGDAINAAIDGKVLVSLRDATHSQGQAGLGCGWGGASFANLSIKDNSR
jgi:galactosylceramidase